jgi:transposase
VITEEAKAWVVHLACSKPKDHGYAAELWTRSLLARHVRQHAEQAGHPSLAKAAKATVHRILAAQPLHPERVQYKRLGTCSILAALDLHDGHVTARVERRHRSREFIDLLKDLDTWYPADCTLRLVLDNHSAHISKETRAYLATRPNRFQYVLTPKHGSWLNIVETLFGKMARTFLRHIRVQSWAELRQRIIQGIAEINAAPVVHR